jgi:3'-phosphoadenosine 5'-phosphosulfate sulfotransferase (PAPS reductase)/FAD synthetase
MSQAKHVVALSGGKDSTALALWLVENEPRDYEFICNETGDELPDMLAHWANLEKMLGSPLIRVRHTESLTELCETQNALPNWRQRWCTRILKIEPTIRYMQTLSDDSVLYVGLRADEESRPGIYGEDIKSRFPLREIGFNESDVYAFLEARGVCIPARTDCGLCYYQRLGEWQTLYFEHPKKYAEGVALEKKTGYTFRSPGRDKWPADLESLGKEFAAGRQPRKYNNEARCRVCSL